MPSVKSLPHYQWTDLGIFLSVLEQGSLSKAAKILEVSQSTVTRRLKALERDLQISLFERSVDGATPTEAAFELAPLAEQMLGLAREIEQRILGLDPSIRGRVRVAMPEGIANFLVIPQIASLHAVHPDIELDLVAAIEHVDMTRNEADLALRLTKPQHGPLTVQRVGTLRYSVFVPEKLWCQPNTQVQGSDLAELDWVTWSKQHTHVPDAAWLQRYVPEARCVVRLRSMGAIVHAVAADVGAAILPSTLGAALPNAVRLDIDIPTPEIPLWLVGHRDNKNISRIQIVAEFLVQTCKALA